MRLTISEQSLQTAGGNKVVMMDQPGEQTILLSNSNNKATAVTVSFQGDGSVHIQSKGPVTVDGSVITLDAGEQGEIKLHAKTITMVAEDDVMVSSKTKGTPNRTGPPCFGRSGPSCPRRCRRKWPRARSAPGSGTTTWSLTPSSWRSANP